jgi:hypothetical protein
MSADATIAAAPTENLVYVNGIDFDTGQYAVPPRPIDELAKLVLQPGESGEKIMRRRGLRGSHHPKRRLCA